LDNIKNCQFFISKGEISVLRAEVKKVEVKLENERQERHKLHDKKAQEIAEVEAKAKIQIESMKSERDFIARELELAKDLLRKKDKKLKDTSTERGDSPSKRMKIESQQFYSPDQTHKKVNKRMHVETGKIPQSIDRYVRLLDMSLLHVIHTVLSYSHSYIVLISMQVIML